MEIKRFFLPEQMYHINKQIHRRELADAFVTDKAVTGQVTRLNLKNQLFEVNLGNQFNAIMPFEESTIYNIYKDIRQKDLSPAIYTLVGRTIRAKITSLKNGIYLSRKDNMIEALAYLKGYSQFDQAMITAFSNCSAFIDVGAGITGKISTFNFSPTRFDNIKDIGLKVNDIIPVQVLDFNPEENHFELSRVSLIPPFEETLDPLDQVVCKVFHALPDKTGYYVLINQSICGILDSPIDSSIELNYGDWVVGLVAKVNPSKKGPQLRFVMKL